MSTIINSFNFVIVMVLVYVQEIIVWVTIVLNRIAIITDLHVDGHISLK